MTGVNPTMLVIHFLYVAQSGTHVDIILGGIDPNPNDLPTGSANYVYGFSHQAWRAILPYYITAYKTGIRPNITSDTVIYWYRPYPKAAVATTDALGLPAVDNQDVTPSDFTPSQVLNDSVFIVALLQASATLTLTSGSTSQSMELASGT